MSRSVFCSGCGFRVEVPADSKRCRIPCSRCGVVCELPPPAPQAAAPLPKEPKTVVVTCNFCGEQVRVAVAKDQTETCPCCHSPVALPSPSGPRPSAPAPQPGPRPTTLADEWGKAGVVFSTADDGKAYPVEGAGDVRCPECRRVAPKGSAVCKGCGYNFVTAEKAPPKTYEPYTNQWEIGMPLARRRKLFFAAQAVAVTFALLGAWLQGSFGLFVVPWVLCTLVLAFVLGTYDRVDLTRTARGQVRLTRTWRVCFFQRPALTIRPHDYEGVVTGPVGESSCWDWMVFLILLWFGIIPGVIWFYLAIYRQTHFVALTKDHGYPALPLCRSGNQEQMRAIAAALHEVAELPYAS